MASTTQPINLRVSDDETLQALQAAVGVLAAKWSVVVLARLAEGTHRFNELLRQIDGVSRRMLSATLRQLERDGLVERHVYARVPARVEYELSPVGEHLLVALVPLAGWGLEHPSTSRTPASTSTACSAGAPRARRSRRARRPTPAASSS